MILTILLPSRGEKECKQVVNLPSTLTDLELISTIAKQISGKETCLRNKDYFLK